MVGTHHIVWGSAAAFTASCALCGAYPHLSGTAAFSALRGLWFPCPMPVEGTRDCLTFAAYLALFAVGLRAPDIDQRIAWLRHRTWTHSVWALLACGTLARYAPAFRGLVIGVFLHIAADSFSAAGVCWLYPLARYVYQPSGAFYVKHAVRAYRTGEKSEAVFLAVSLVLFAACSILVERYAGGVSAFVRMLA